MKTHYKEINFQFFKDLEIPENTVFYEVDDFIYIDIQSLEIIYKLKIGEIVFDYFLKNIRFSHTVSKNGSLEIILGQQNKYFVALKYVGEDYRGVGKDGNMISIDVLYDLNTKNYLTSEKEEYKLTSQSIQLNYAYEKENYQVYRLKKLLEFRSEAKKYRKVNAALGNIENDIEVMKQHYLNTNSVALRLFNPTKGFYAEIQFISFSKFNKLTCEKEDSFILLQNHLSFYSKKQNIFYLVSLPQLTTFIVNTTEKIIRPELFTFPILKNDSFILKFKFNSFKSINHNYIEKFEKEVFYNLNTKKIIDVSDLNILYDINYMLIVEYNKSKENLQKLITFIDFSTKLKVKTKALNELRDTKNYSSVEDYLVDPESKKYFNIRE